MEENEKINEEKIEVVENQTAEVVENISNDEKAESTVNTNSKTFSIAALILGIVAFLLTKSGTVSLICAILAIVFGIKGQKMEGKGMAKAGMILGIVYLSLVALAFILVTVLGVAVLSSASSLF